jgi:ribosomal protein L14
MGNRIFGPIPREIKELGYEKIANLAPELVWKSKREIKF